MATLRLLGFGLLVVISMLVASSPSAAAFADPLVGAYYWNIGDGDASNTATDTARIDHFRALRVSEVHLWLNENRATPPCGYLYRYSEGGAVLWTPSRLQQFTQNLKLAGLKVVYTLSPDIRTSGYIASLAAKGGPLDVASRVTGVDIELDIEGNGAGPRCPVDGLFADDADRLLLQTIHKTTPTSRIVVSTVRGYDTRHPVLMTGTDAISPQLYGAHYAFSLPSTQATFGYFRKTYPTKPLWAALSVECSESNASLGRCSKALLLSEIKLIADAHRSAGALVPKYVMWGEREAKRCPGKPLCSVFAQDLLANRSEQ